MRKKQDVRGTASCGSSPSSRSREGKRKNKQRKWCSEEKQDWRHFSVVLLFPPPSKPSKTRESPKREKKKERPLKQYSSFTTKSVGIRWWPRCPVRTMAPPLRREADAKFLLADKKDTAPAPRSCVGRRCRRSRNKLLEAQREGVTITKWEVEIKSGDTADEAGRMKNNRPALP